jgi:AbrB family looped-hinge helix DNA binding protein
VQNVIKVIRRGQTTIPAEIRKKLGIREGDQLWVETTEKGALFKPIPRLEDMAGADAK